MAPDLVQIQRYFEDEQVVFISLTPDDEAAAKRFVSRHHVDWLVGWGAEDVVQRFLGTRYPVLIVVGRDGRVVWNDGAARLQHRQGEAAPALFEQIKKAVTAD